MLALLAQGLVLVPVGDGSLSAKARLQSQVPMSQVQLGRRAAVTAAGAATLIAVGCRQEVGQQHLARRGQC